MAARHISAVTLEAELRWSFVAASRSRFVTITPVVSLLFDPASLSAAGAPTLLRQDLQGMIEFDYLPRGENGLASNQEPRWNKSRPRAGLAPVSSWLTKSHRLPLPLPSKRTALLGRARKQKGEDGRIRPRPQWRRIGTLFLILLLAGWTGKTAFFYWLFKHRHDYPEITVSEMVLFPLNWPEFRRRMGDYHLTLSEKAIGGRPSFMLAWEPPDLLITSMAGSLWRAATWPRTGWIGPSRNWMRPCRTGVKTWNF